MYDWEGRTQDLYRGWKQNPKRCSDSLGDGDPQKPLGDEVKGVALPSIATELLALAAVSLPPRLVTGLLRRLVEVGRDLLADLFKVIAAGSCLLRGTNELGATLLGERLDLALARDDILALAAEQGTLSRKELLLDADGEDPLAARSDLLDASLRDFGDERRRQRGRVSGVEDAAEVSNRVGSSAGSAQRLDVQVVKLLVEGLESASELFFELQKKRRDVSLGAFFPSNTCSARTHSLLDLGLQEATNGSLGEPSTDGTLTLADADVEAVDADLDLLELEERLAVVLGRVRDDEHAVDTVVGFRVVGRSKVDVEHARVLEAEPVLLDVDVVADVGRLHAQAGKGEGRASLEVGSVGCVALLSRELDVRAEVRGVRNERSAVKRHLISLETMYCLLG